MSFSSVFPGRVAISPVEAGRAAFGWSPKTTANRLLAGTFPLPIVGIGNRRVCRVSDLDSLFAFPAASAEAVAAPAKRGRGRPRKTASCAAAAGEVRHG